MAHFLRQSRKKPGYPLQVLGFARLHGRVGAASSADQSQAKPAGFPLLSLAQPMGKLHGRQTGRSILHAIILIWKAWFIPRR
jgi:hypothetical protein